ncbi:MAG: hypothetical protein JSU74_12735 [Candidatus Zixiibacteriota bacterium]|nr:MAG: hypothetical protein JSU74_12735 [candidate division Zixibacteria bacterium]
MKLWQKFIIKCTTFDTIEDYDGARRVLRDEVKVYRKHWQFVVGMILFFVSALYLLYALDNWYLRLVLLAVVVGETMIRDAVTEHLCLKIYKDKLKQLVSRLE